VSEPQVQLASSPTELSYCPSALVDPPARTIIASSELRLLDFSVELSLINPASCDHADQLNRSSSSSIKLDTWPPLLPVPP